MTLAAMGAELRARREARGVTRAALAEAVGSRPVMVGRWERGEAVPTREEARALARVLELPPGEAGGWEAAAEAGAWAGESTWWAGRRAGSPFRWRWWRGVGSFLGRGRPADEPGGREADAAPRSYLDDPAEQRRYAIRWGLTLVALAAMAVAAIWLLGELTDGWRAVLELFRSRPVEAGSAAVPALLHLV